MCWVLGDGKQNMLHKNNITLRTTVNASSMERRLWTRRDCQTTIQKAVLPANFANSSTYAVARINRKRVGFDENNLEKMTNTVLRFLTEYLFLVNANLSSVSFSSATTPHRGDTIPNKNEFPLYSIFQKNKNIFPIKCIQIITYICVSKNEFFLKTIN